MRIQQLYIGKFKNLREFRIEFDQDSFTTVLVGRNGTGKSNLLEALISIFRNLDLGEEPPFQYDIDYEYGPDDIKVNIKGNPALKPSEQVLVTLNGDAVPFRMNQRVEREYLPTHVFGYYSGPSDRMAHYFDKHQDLFYRQLLNEKADSDDEIRTQHIRRLFYALGVHSQFVLLAFFTEPEEQIRSFLRDALHIKGLHSVLFILRKPPWASKVGDPRFWNARGGVSTFLDRLYAHALAPLRGEQKVNQNLRQLSNVEHLYLYLKDQEALISLASGYTSQQDFFSALESTYLSQLLSEVRIRVQMESVDGTLTFRDLSEGEQQLLTVLGLLRFTKRDEALFLLDEPDTHLNPAWSIEYLDFIKQVVGVPDSSHVIMATHNPMVVAGLAKSQVHIMQRNDETGAITAEHPEEEPRGMGIGALLTSDIYGLRSDLDKETLKLLDKKRRLASKFELNETERLELTSLNDMLEDLDFTTSVSDPLYKPFVDAMTQIEVSEGLQVPVLSREQQDRRKEVAEGIVAKLQSDEDAKQ